MGEDVDEEEVNSPQGKKRKPEGLQKTRTWKVGAKLILQIFGTPVWRQALRSEAQCSLKSCAATAAGFC